MFVDFVISLGIALRGRFAQHCNGLRLLFRRHGFRHRDLEVRILGVSGEGHVAARAPQVPTAAQRRVADIFRRISGKAETELARIFRCERWLGRCCFALGGVGLQRRQE